MILIVGTWQDNYKFKHNKVFLKRLQNDVHIFVIILDPAYVGPDNFLNGRIFLPGYPVALMFKDGPLFFWRWGGGGILK